MYTEIKGQNDHFQVSKLQGPQGLSVHFNLAQIGRKKVAISKLMIPSNSQRRNNSKGEVSFYVPIMYQPQ